MGLPGNVVTGTDKAIFIIILKMVDKCILSAATGGERQSKVAAPVVIPKQEKYHSYSGIYFK